MSFKDVLLKKILESDSSSVDYTPTAYQDPEDKKLNADFDDEIRLDLDTSNFKFDDNEDPDDIDGVEADKIELADMLDFASDDLINLILNILNDNYSLLLKSLDELKMLLKSLDREDFEEYAYLILSIIDDYYNYHEDFEQYGADPVDETIVDIAHTKQLRRNRKKSLWKRNAILRARFRKTGEGKRQRKKALKYLKKYRRQNKAKLARYSKKYNQVWKGNKK